MTGKHAQMKMKLYRKLIGRNELVFRLLKDMFKRLSHFDDQWLSSPLSLLGCLIGRNFVERTRINSMPSDSVLLRPNSPLNLYRLIHMESQDMLYDLAFAAFDIPFPRWICRGFVIIFFFCFTIRFHSIEKKKTGKMRGNLTESATKTHFCSKRMEWKSGSHRCFVWCNFALRNIHHGIFRISEAQSVPIDVFLMCLFLCVSSFHLFNGI